MIEIFKKHILNSAGYEGGRGFDSISSKGKIYKLSSNENVFGTSPLVSTAIKDACETLNYYPENRPESLQIALQEHYQNKMTAEQFVVANGGSEIIDLLGRAFLGPGLECIVSNPGFMPYTMFARWVGARVVDVPLLSPDYGLDVEGILNAVNDQTRLIYLTNPNNPTGTYVPKEMVQYLIKQLPDHVVFVIDEVYHHYVKANDYARAFSFMDSGRHVVAINSFSKAYGLAALRIGYAYSSETISAYVRKLCRPFLVSTINIAAAKAALKDQEFVQRIVEIVHAEKKKYTQLFEDLGIRFWPSEANFILMRPGIEEDQFVRDMQENRVMVRPTSKFGAPGCVRITIGTPEANDHAIQAIKSIHT